MHTTNTSLTSRHIHAASLLRIKDTAKPLLRGIFAGAAMLFLSLSAKAQVLYVGGTNETVTINTSINYDGTIIGNDLGSDSNSLIVTGAGVTVENNDGITGVVVGSSGSYNSMTISGGATVTSDAGLAVGLNAGSTGNTLTVTDVSSVLEVTNGVFAGYDDGANGNQINITNGAVINADFLTVGAYLNANNNSLNVSGSGSQLNLSGQLVVGSAANANNSLAIADGASVNSAAAFVGANNGPGASSSANTAQVTSGSSWNVNGSFYVGDGSSDNSLTVSGGSAITVNNAVATNAYFKISTDQAGSGNASANNSVLVTDAGSSLTVASSIAGGGITIGDTGSGTLTVANEGVIDSPNINIAANVGSTGTLNVGALGGTDTAGTIVASNIYFGTNGGTAALNFNQTDATTVSANIQGDGSVNQLGSGQTILTGINTYTGGTLISGGTLQFGTDTAQVSSIGSGAVSLTNGGVLALGQYNSFTLSNTISGDGQLVQSGNGATILTGNNTYTGGTAIQRGTLQVGTNGTTGSIGNGPVSMTLGSTLVYNRSDIKTLGQNISGEGNLSLIGSGITILSGTTSLTNGITKIDGGSVAVTGSMNGGASQQLLVGNTNSGVALTFSGGNTNYANSLIIGASNGANNNIVTVNNASLITTDTVGVGVRSTGGGSGNTLIITNDGVVESGNLFVGSGNNVSGSNNSVIVTGLNSRMINDASVGNFIGYGSTGNNITVSNGASLETIGNTYISYTASASNNSVLVTGALSEWTGAGAVFIGNSNSGSADVTITQGASITASAINIASQGTLNIGTFGANGTGGTVTGPVSFGSGTGRVNFNQSDSATFTNGITGSAGSVNQLGTGTTTLSGNNFYGATRVAAGTLLVTGTSGTGSVTVESGATLGGTGTIKGAAEIQSGATLAAGVGGAGALTFTNGLTLDAGSTTQVNANFSSINVNGNMLTYGGAFQINADTLSYGPTTYALFVLNGTTPTGNFDSVTINLAGYGVLTMQYNTVLEAPNVWVVGTSGYESWQFNQATGILSSQAVPEPSTYVLCGIGALALVIAYRRRRVS